MTGYDAVVVGAGHNGLVCGTYLARAGLRTVIVERSDRPGGGCATREPWPGYRLSTAGPLALPAPGLLAEIGSEVDLVPLDLAGYLPTETGGVALGWDPEATRRSVAGSVSAAEADGFAALLALFDEAARRLLPFYSYAATRKQVRRAFRASEVEKLYARTVTASIGDAARAHVGSDLLQGYAAGALLGSEAGPETPGSAFLFLHRRVAQAGAAGWVRGGAGALADGLVAAFRRAGGELRLEAPAARILLAARRAGGVALESGEEIEASVVCSGADPKRTLDLVPEGALLPEFVDDVALLPTRGAALRIDWALGGLPRFAGRSPGTPGPEHRTTITIAPGLADLERACRQAADGTVPDEVLCEVWFGSVLDPGSAPEGKHTMSALVQYVPQVAAADWAGARDRVAERALAAVERRAPGTTDLVERIDALGPPELERRYGTTGGHLFHGEMLPGWLFDERPAPSWHRYRTPLPGLYLCSAGCHPGGGMSGLPGRNAARCVIEDRVAAAAGV